MMSAEIEGARLTQEEIIANLIVTMVGGQETTTNLIGNGMLSCEIRPNWSVCVQIYRSSRALWKNCSAMKAQPYTARLAPSDVELGKQIRKRQAVIAVMGAGNRDPERFPDPDLLGITRKNNQHLAFGWAAHFCFGAALARLEGQIAFTTILRRLPQLSLNTQGPLVWRHNLGLRGLTSLPVEFVASDPAKPRHF